MNPLLQKYASLTVSGKTISRMEWIIGSLGPRHPVGLRYIYEDGDEILDISHLSFDEYCKYEKQMKTTWQFLSENPRPTS